MLRIDGDRRRYPREPLERPCKIYDPRARKYIHATTLDVSGGGLLIDVPRLLEIKPGERLHVGVAMTRRHSLLLAKDMMEAIVVRSSATIDDHTTMAVTFDAPAALYDDDAILRAAA